MSITIRKTIIQVPPAELNHPVLAVAQTAAAKAGQIISDYFYQGVQIRSKAISELVSDADVDAEKCIIREIRDAFPTHSILAEESGQDTAEADHLWVIDPLDGTNNFAHHIPHFAVSIGYYYQGRAECGVITNPMTGDWYFAVAGQGAWYNGEKMQVSQAENLNEVLIGIGFYYDRGAMMEATLAAVRDFFHQNIHGVRRFGTASLDLGQVGRGLFGAYFEYQLSPWDFAAGQLFVQEAGGQVTDCAGKVLPIDSSSSILASNTRLHPAALAITREHFAIWR